MLIRLAHLTDESSLDVLARIKFFDPVERFERCFREKLSGIDAFSASELGHAYRNYAGQGLGTQVDQ